MLIYPRFRYHNTGGIQEPLGILYLAGALKIAGHDVKVKDLTFRDGDEGVEELLEGVDLVGLSASTALFGRALSINRRIKSRRPDLEVVLGGPHATALPIKALECGFDAVVIGEGEETMVELAGAIENHDDLSKVRGIAYFNDGQALTNPPREFIGDIDSIPFPRREYIDYPLYFAEGLNLVGIVAMRGCPHRCTYCKPMQDKLFGKKIRRRSPENVAEEIHQVSREITDRGILFRDDSFTTNPREWFGDMKKELNERGTKIWGWACQGRVDQIPRDKLEAMQDAGCKLIAFGVESGSQRILDFYRKEITVEETERAFSLCKELGIATHAFVMIGAPGETKEDVELTIKLIERIRPNSVSPSITTPAPGTQLFKTATEQGIYNIDDWEESDYMQNRRPLKLEHLSEEFIDRAKSTLAAMGTGYP